jgi:hypothetical protein
MFIASIITGWFVARDAANLQVMELAVSLLLIIFLIAVGISWPYLVAWFADWRARRRSCSQSGTGQVRSTPASRGTRAQ